MNIQKTENTFLAGYEGFVRSNPLSDKISAQRFHHVEFYCGDATNTYKRFMLALGLDLVAKSDFSTGNTLHASYTLQSGDLRMLFTAPYQEEASNNNNNNENINSNNNKKSMPGFDSTVANNFFCKHGLGVRAIGIVVEDLLLSHRSMVSSGAESVLEPTVLLDEKGEVLISEVKLYGDAVLRLVQNVSYSGMFLPNFKDLKTTADRSGKYGIDRFDHIVGNVWSLRESMERVKNITGFHDFAEFVAEDVGTVDSGLNSVVLANNNEFILLPLNEPTYGTKRKSQIQTYLEQNKGEGVQHLALFSTEIFATMQRMRDATELGGFEFQEPQPNSYYNNVRERVGNSLNEEQYQLAQKYGLLIDKDDQGVLLQVFTKPLGDRPTVFIEIIQRIGCLENNIQKPGCGGFGKGNFKDLFKSIEDYEKSLNIN